MLVTGSKETLEEKQFYTGTGSWCSKYPVWIVEGVEVCCAGGFACSLKCWKMRVRCWVCVVRSYSRVEMLKTYRCLVTEITGMLSFEYRVLNRLEFVQDVRNTVSLDGGLSLLPVVVAARVFEALRILTGTAVFLVGLKRARILSINLSHKADIPPC